MVVRRAALADIGERLVRRFPEAQAHPRAAPARPRDDAQSAVQFPAEVEQDAASAAYLRPLPLFQPYLVREALRQQFRSGNVPLRHKDAYGAHELPDPAVGLICLIHVPELLRPSPARGQPRGGNVRIFYIYPKGFPRA